MVRLMMVDLLIAVLEEDGGESSRAAPVTHFAGYLQQTINRRPDNEDLPFWMD